MPNRKRHKTWIVVADGARARILEQAAWRQPLELVEDLEDEAARRRPREIESDDRGRVFDRGGPGRHAMETPTDPQRHEKERFAKQLAGRLNQAAHGGRFDRLVLVAAAQMLGDLRRELDKGAADRVSHELAKDLTAVSIHELPRHLGDIVEVPDPRQVAASR